jgi:oligopeptide/dipeptide ABC transporter ATP-binding protein
VVLDEPTSTLDATARSEILGLLAELQEEFGMSYLFISHDLTAVERISHRIAIMYLGRIVEMGPARDVVNAQFHPYGRALLSAVLYPDPDRKPEPFLLTGEIPSAINPRDECSLVGRCPLAEPYCSTAFPPLEKAGEERVVACYRWREFASVESLDPKAREERTSSMWNAGRTVTKEMGEEVWES